MTYNINEYMGNPLELREINTSNKKCHIINVPITINHLIPINDQFLIGSEYKSLDIYNLKSNYANRISNENIYIINIKTEQYYKATIINFPEEIPFHPQGLSLYKKANNEYILYILNHASVLYEDKGRIEIINIAYNPKTEEISMIYDNYILLPNEYFLKIDSINVINEDIFYFTTNNPFPFLRGQKDFLDIKKKLLNYAYEFLKPIMIMLNIKKCYVYIYNRKNTAKEIEIIANSESLNNKGITYDKKRNLIYVVKALEKKISIFKIDEYNTTKYIKSIPILYVGNNIYYDEDKDLIYIGINGKMNEYDSIVHSYKKNQNFENVETYSGYEIIDPKNNYSINELMLMKSEFKWVTSSIQINDKNYMSSIFSKGIYVCGN